MRCADELSCKEMGVGVGLGEWTHVIGQIFVKGAHGNVISVLMHGVFLLIVASPVECGTVFKK